MLHRLNPLQDENSQPYVPGKRTGNDVAKRFAGHAGSTPAGKQVGPSSARKALGNITNRTATVQQEGATPFKGTPGLLGPRKTLGDITNVTPGQIAKPVLAKQAQQRGSIARPRLAKHRSKAEIYAEEGVERLAGKGKQQLEAEREHRDLADAKWKAAHIASLPALQPPILQRPKVSLPILLMK